MPISKVEYPHEVEYVQVLDAEGNLDEDLDPQIPRADLRKLYRAMILARAHDENRERLQRQGEIGTFAPAFGQEAAQLGSIYAIREDDWFVPSFREVAAGIWRGFPLERDLLYAAGFEEGIEIPEDAHDMPLNIPIGTQINHAVGIAWARRLRGTDEVAITYIGDGGTSEGDFHEGMNFAAVYQLPLVVVCQNNHWAISVPLHKQMRSKTIAQKGWAYGMPGVQVDGNDLLAVYRVTKEAVERARAGKGPTFIEAITYRMKFHTTADDPKKYRKDEEVEPWVARDPIKRLRRYMIDRGHLSEDEDEAWQEEVRAEVKEAVEKFRRLVPKGLDNIFEHKLARLDPYTERQRKELQDYWGRHGLEAGGH